MTTPSPKPAAPEPPTQTRATPPVRVRPSTLDDYEAITAGIRGEMGMVSPAEYRRRWSTNPFQPSSRAGQTGWLMETVDDGAVVGWFGNIFSGYELGGRPILAASMHAVAVKEAFRNRSMPLVTSYFRQTEPELLLVTTANEKAGQVWQAMKMLKVPVPDYDVVRYWIASPSRFAAAALRRKKVPAAGLAGAALGVGLGVSDGLSRRRLRALPPGVPSPVCSRDFDERFDEFWSRLRSRRRNANRLLAVRSRGALAWHFYDARVNNALAIVTIEQPGSGGRLAGYAILNRRDAVELGLSRYQIADLQVCAGPDELAADDDPALVQALLVGCMRATREDGVHVLEAIGFDAFKRGVIDATGPRRRRSPAWPYLYKAQSATLATQLGSPDAWDPCPFDGDAAF